MTFASGRPISCIALAVLLLAATAATAQQSGPNSPPRPKVRQAGPNQIRRPGRQVVRAGGARRPAAIQAPFQLTPQQQAFLDQLLPAWEKRNDKIKNFKCKFTRWEYSKAFGPHNAKGRLIAHTISEGEIRYGNPDQGMMKVDSKRIWGRRAKGYITAKGESGEHWVCDGKAVYELDAAVKQLNVHPIPPAMQGKAISEGPLPFLFGAKADRLKARYFMREHTDAKYTDKEIWLEAYPRRQRDAANFRRVQLIMTRDDFLPYALRVYLPGGGDFVVYEFKKMVTNHPFARSIKEPKTPRGWKRIVHNLPPATGYPNARTASGPSRK